MNLIDLKERIAISDAFTPAERDYLLDAINRDSGDDRSQWQWSCGHTAGAHCAECYRVLAARANQLAEQAMRLIAEVEAEKRK